MPSLFLAHGVYEGKARKCLVGENDGLAVSESNFLFYPVSQALPFLFILFIYCFVGTASRLPIQKLVYAHDIIRLVRQTASQASVYSALFS